MDSRNASPIQHMIGFWDLLQMSIIYPNVVSAAGVKKKQKYIAVSLMYDASLEFDAGLNLFFLFLFFLLVCYLLCSGLIYWKFSVQTLIP